LIKHYDELTFTDDFLFCKILSNNLSLCAGIIELILGIRVRKLVLAEKQKQIEITADGRGIRLDVYVEDDHDTVFDLEMQTVTKPNIPKRSRYYQGMIDLNLIERGADFSELRKSYVVFICLDDASFGKGLPVYTFENRCRECPELVFGDDSVKVVVNASSEDPRMTDGMRDFLGFLLNGHGNSDLVKRIEEDVRNAKDKEAWRLEFMTLFMRDREKIAEGRAEGRAEGIVEGVAKGRFAAYAELVRDGDMTIEKAAEKLQMGIDEFKQKVKELSINL